MIMRHGGQSGVRIIINKQRPLTSTHGAVRGVNKPYGHTSTHGGQGELRIMNKQVIHTSTLGGQTVVRGVNKPLTHTSTQSGLRAMNKLHPSTSTHGLVHISKKASTAAPTSIPIPRPPQDPVSLLMAKVQALEKKIQEHEFHSHQFIPDHTHTPSPTPGKTHAHNNIPTHTHTPSVPANNKVTAHSTMTPPDRVARKPDSIASPSRIHHTFPGGTGGIALGGRFGVFSPTPGPIPTTTHYMPSVQPYQPVHMPPHLSNSHGNGVQGDRPRGGPLHPPPPAHAVPMIPQPPQIVAPSIPRPSKHNHHMPVVHQPIDPVAHAPIPGPTRQPPMPQPQPTAHPMGPMVNQPINQQVIQPVNPSMQGTLPPVINRQTQAMPLPEQGAYISTWTTTVTDAPLPSVSPPIVGNKNSNVNNAGPVDTANNANANNNNGANVNSNTVDTNANPQPAPTPAEDPVVSTNTNSNGATSGTSTKRSEWNNNNSGQQKAAGLENPPPKPSSESNTIQTQPPAGEFEGSQAREMVVDQLTGMIAANQNASTAERTMVRDWLSGIEELPTLMLGLTWADRQNMRQNPPALINNNEIASGQTAGGQGGFFRDQFAGVFDPFYVQTTNSPWSQRSPFTSGWW